jgi:hypothetical protein
MRRTSAIIERIRLLGSDLVMTLDHEITIRLKRPIDLTQSLDEVPCEGVVVVDKQDHA